MEELDKSKGDYKTILIWITSITGLIWLGFAFVYREALFTFEIWGSSGGEYLSFVCGMDILFKIIGFSQPLLLFLSWKLLKKGKWKKSQILANIVVFISSLMAIMIAFRAV